MKKFETIITHYCPTLFKNIVIEKVVNEDDFESYVCLNKPQCKGNGCTNTLLNSTILKGENQAN